MQRGAAPLGSPTQEQNKEKAKQGSKGYLCKKKGSKGYLCKKKGSKGYWSLFASFETCSAVIPVCLIVSYAYPAHSC
jgi:hypothetical protein